MKKGVFRIVIVLLVMMSFIGCDRMNSARRLQLSGCSLYTEQIR